MYFSVLYLGPINKISCFTSFHSQNARVAGGYLYLLFKAKQIKLIVSQAFFLGKPMGMRLFFFVCKPQPQLFSDQKPQASHSRE